MSECSHPRTELRSRTISGGSRQIVYQCLVCGRAASNPISKEKARETSNIIDLPAYDDELLDGWLKKNEKERDKIRDQEKSVFLAWYDEYLKTPKWAALRHKVLARAEMVCEGCGDHRATEVHHLTYEHVGDEFMFELLAVCHSCHERIHTEEEMTWPIP